MHVVGADAIRGHLWQIYGAKEHVELVEGMRWHELERAHDFALRRQALGREVARYQTFDERRKALDEGLQNKRRKQIRQLGVDQPGIGQVEVGHDAFTDLADVRLVRVSDQLHPLGRWLCTAWNPATAST